MTPQTDMTQEWLDRLQTDPTWTERLRTELHERGGEPGDLVVVLARSKEYPRAAAGSEQVEMCGGHWFAVVTRTAHVLDAPMPPPDFEALRTREPIHQAHALLLDAARAVPFRFVPPTAPSC